MFTCRVWLRVWRIPRVTAFGDGGLHPWSVPVWPPWHSVGLTVEPCWGCQYQASWLTKSDGKSANRLQKQRSKNNKTSKTTKYNFVLNWLSVNCHTNVSCKQEKVMYYHNKNFCIIHRTFWTLHFFSMHQWPSNKFVFNIFSKFGFFVKKLGLRLNEKNTDGNWNLS